MVDGDFQDTYTSDSDFEFEPVSGGETVQIDDLDLNDIELNEQTLQKIRNEIEIEGNDEMSEQMNTILESEVVANTCDSNGIVAIKILNTSEECKFFAQIYPIVCVPSTFCIGDGGVPLEVIGGHLKLEDFHAKLQATINTYKQQKQGAAIAPPVTTPGAGNSEKPSVTTTTTAEAPPMAAGVDNSSTAMSPVPSTSTADMEASGDKLPLDEKLEKAKQLLEENRAAKTMKEKEKQRSEEIERRSHGRDLQKLRQGQADSEMLEVRQQMRKDKEEDRLAREKIKAQIVKDREERHQRYSKEKAEREQTQQEAKRARLEEQQKAAVQEEAMKSATARIQIRLPDGSSITQTYESSETLQAVHDTVAQRLGGAVTLSTTFPRQTFTQGDMGRTFIDLQLAPSAVVIAVQAVKSSYKSSSVVSSTNLLATLFSPFLMLWNFLYTFLFRSASQSPPPDRSGRSPTQSTSGGQQESSGHQTSAYQRRNAPDTRPTGNMRRMTDIRDDDDDMTTYNGNSTQQL